MAAVARRLGLLLSGALAAGAAAAPIAEPYRAQGSEPAWSLTIEKGRLTYETPGRRPIAIEAPKPESDEGILYFRAQELSFSVIPVACTDEATGRRYADSVYLTAAGKDFAGCGGAPLPADSLDGTSWHFAEIGGEPTGLTGDILEDDRYALDFGAEAFVGYSGCNRIGGRYRISDGVMNVEGFGSTRRGCGEPHARRERLASRILNGPMKVGRPAPDVLELSGPAGTIRLKRSPD